MKPILPLIKNCFQEDNWTDVDLVGTNGRIFCHKFILASVFPLLHQVFSDISIEEDKIVVIFDEFTLSDIKQLVAFSYGLSKNITKSLVAAIEIVKEPTSEVEKHSFEKEKNDPLKSDIIKSDFSIDYLESFDNYEFSTEESEVKTEFENKENAIILNIKRPFKKKGRPKKLKSDANVDNKCIHCGKVIKGSFTRYTSHVYSRHREHYEQHLQNLPTPATKNVPNIKVWPLPCEKCGKLLFSSTYYKQHQKTHEEKVTISSYTCPEENCKVGFTSKVKYIRHLRTHHNFSNEEILARGGTVAKPVESVQCNMCGVTINKYCLTDHMKLLHGIANSPDYTCQDCGKVFRTKKNFTRHARMHLPDNEKKFQCNICYKGFTKKVVFDGHMNSHLNLKPFKCKVCSQGFQNDSNLRHHLKTVHKTT